MFSLQGVNWTQGPEVCVANRRVHAFCLYSDGPILPRAGEFINNLTVQILSTIVIL